MFVQIKNFRLAYVQAGSGLPILFIHGYPLSSALWEPQLSGLVDAAHLLAVDLRGHGASQALPGPYQMDELADDCVAFMDAINVTRPFVACGLSMGGYVTMALFRKHASRLAGLVLAATRGGADSEEGKANRDKATALARQHGVSAVVDTILPKMLSPKTYTRSPELVEGVRKMMEGTSLEGVLGDLMGLRERPDSMTTLQQVFLPTLIMHGTDDQLIPLSEAEAMASAVRGSELEIIPDAGHLLNLEQPELFNGVMRNFLQRIR